MTKKLTGVTEKVENALKDWGEEGITVAELATLLNVPARQVSSSIVNLRKRGNLTIVGEKRGRLNKRINAYGWKETPKKEKKKYTKKENTKTSEKKKTVRDVKKEEEKLSTNNVRATRKERNPALTHSMVDKVHFLLRSKISNSIDTDEVMTFYGITESEANILLRKMAAQYKLQTTVRVYNKVRNDG